MKKTMTYTCPKEYRRNYKKEIIEGLKAFALCFFTLLYFVVLFYYFQ